MSLFTLYGWTIVAGVLAAPALALLGVQLATRDRAMQTLCVGQGAMVGVLLAMGIFHELEGSVWGTMVPFSMAIVISASTFLLTDWLVAKKTASRNTTFAFVFAVLLSVGHLCSSLFPGLESHMAQVYFGDLATLTALDSQVTSGFAIVCLLLMVSFSRTVSNFSFESAVFGGLISFGKGQRWELAFRILSLVILSFSVQFVGFLFTIAMLFLPTAILNYSPQKGLKRHLWGVSIVSALSSGIGFLLSLHYTRLPTVPTIVIVMMMLSGIVLVAEAAVKGIAREGVKKGPSLEEPLVVKA